jgi:hypothetical protein
METGSAMQLVEASEEEEQAIDRLLGELGIRLPVVEADPDNDDLPGLMSSQNPDQPMRLDELREWWMLPSS